MGNSLLKVIDFASRVIFIPPKRKYSDYLVFKDKFKDDEYLIYGGVGMMMISPPGIKSEKWIVWSNGSGSDIINMYDHLKLLSKNTQCNVLVYDYIGYGQSRDLFFPEDIISGFNLYMNFPTELGCYRSMEIAMAYLLKKVKPENITLIGYSLGTGVTVDYCATSGWKYPIILIAPFKSIHSVILSDSHILTDKFTSLHKIKYLKCKCKIIHGKEDLLVNISHGYLLYHELQAYGLDLEPMWLDGFGHYDILDYFISNPVKL